MPNGRIGIVLLLAVNVKNTGKPGLEVREVGFILRLPPSEVYLTNVAPFVKIQPNVNIAVWTMIAPHATPSAILAIKAGGT